MILQNLALQTSPLISVPLNIEMSSNIFLVMTVYNRENYLSMALDSIIGQTYPHWQLTIWDDGSGDASPDIARKYAQLDSRIIFVPAVHTGLQYALRSAISSAASDYDYLGTVDSDDLLVPETLAATVAILDRYPAIGMVYTDHQIIDEQGQVLGLGKRCQVPYSKDRLLIDFMTFHFRLLRRDIYSLVGGIDLSFPQAEDYDLCLKISEITNVYHLPQPLYHYRIHSQNISRSRHEQQVELSATAVRNALVRRGLSEQYRLEVIEGDRFQIVQQDH
jgi:glycosyltransferase involved in cell wall biosynthesis